MSEKILAYPSNLGNKDIHPAWMEFQFFNRKSPTSSPPDDTIQLYMPESAANPSTVNWNNEALGYIGNKMINSGITGGNGLEGAWDSARAAASVGYERAKAGIQAGIANRLGGRVNAESFLAAQGKVPNPYLTMIFKGVDFRSFSFVFKFYPFTEKDSDTIHEIIKTFRKNSLPNYEDEQSAFIGYPKEVEVSYMWKGDKNKYLHRFKRSVITGFDVDYTPNGMFSVMRNGIPACINVSMKLTEIELVLRKDVEMGF